MDIDIEKLVKAAAEGLDLSKFKGDVVGVKIVENEIGNVEEGGIGIKNEYYSSPKPKSTKAKSTGKTISKGTPMTLKYYKHGKNSLLMKQRKRVDIVFRKWTEWKWIDEKTAADDFDSFFEGEPRHCNINWIANTTILTILLQELIEQPYIGKQTGLSAKSLVKVQFGKSPSSDRTRLDEDAEDKIKLTLFILDTKNPLPEQNSNEASEDYDIRDEALKLVFAGQLHLSKSI